MALHLIKLAVGIDSIEELAVWQRKEYTHHNGRKAAIIHTRYKPRRAEEILATQGSVYRVIKGHILCRQRIIGFDTAEDKKRGHHCLILTDTDIIRTYPMPHRPFQGWRYQADTASPKDIGPYVPGGNETSIPIETELKALGLL